MKIIGLTGAFASGKSTMCQLFASFGVPIFDADQIVGSLYDNHAGFKVFLEENYASYFKNGVLNRRQLSEDAFSNPDLLLPLEAYLHPIVKKKRDKFVNEKRKEQQKLVVCDIPLLFETKQEDDYDLICLCLCSPETQEKRALDRGITLEKLEHIRKLQMSNEEKIKKSDKILDTDKPLLDLKEDIKRLIESI